MSRIFPKRFDGYMVDNEDYFNWYVIVCNGDDVGSVWLEKENIEENFVQLGIIIGHEDLFGKGIGRKAIGLVMQESKLFIHSPKVRLNVRQSNIRAQACYSSCGFRVVRKGIKTNSHGERIEFLTMEN
jgi:RimJ/RimL family protein N-acetyltransferase